MLHDFIIFILTAVAVLAARALWSPKISDFTSKIEPPHSLITPAQALHLDLGNVFNRVNQRLGEGIKTSSFPITINIGEGGWCDDHVRVEVVSAQLQSAGWRVTKSPKCRPTEIIVDVPRIRFT